MTKEQTNIVCSTAQRHCLNGAENNIVFTGMQ